MGLIARQTIKGSVASYVGVGLGTFTLLFLFPAFLSQEQIGLLRIVTNAAGMFSTLAVLGIPQISVKYLPYVQQGDDYRAYATLLYIVPLVGVLLCYLIFLAFKQPITDFYSQNAKELTRYYYLVWSITLLNTLYLAAASYARMNNRIVVPSAIKDVGIRVLTILFFLGIVVKWFDFDHFLNLQIAIYGLALLGVFWYNHRLAPFRPLFQFWRLKPHLKGVASFGLFSVLTSTASILVTTIDSLMIGGMINLGNAGIYVIASYIGLVIEMPKRSLNAIAGPVLSESWKHQNIEKINELHARSSINQLLFGGSMLLLIWAGIDGIFYIMPNGETYSAGKWVVLFIGLAKLTDLAFGLTAEIISFSPKYRYNLYLLLLLAGIAVVTNYFLIPLYGITGAGLATFISYLVYNLLSYYLMKRDYGITPFNTSSAKALMLLVFVFILVHFISIDIPVVLLSLLKVILAAVLLFIGIIYYRLSPDLSLLVKSSADILKNFIKK
ncbi:MAG: polysaccharide biosynthesis C-terminal domain-containing protein [Thermaurantimonas sp.]|uniref:oligosaccharide flippase family protein n=1 Tax=Thermaurantimonas sp. TaxID=2681568 RepID=UPI003918F6AB